MWGFGLLAKELKSRGQNQVCDSQMYLWKTIFPSTYCRQNSRDVLSMCFLERTVWTGQERSSLLVLGFPGLEIGILLYTSYAK